MNGFRRHQLRRARAAAAAAPKPAPPRAETDILNDLRILCRTPGFAHIVAQMIVRDNFILYGDEMKSSDLEHLYGLDRLIRSEINLLIGYMVQGTSDTFDVLPADPEGLVEQTEALLAELHRRLAPPPLAAPDAGSLETATDDQGRAEAMREPIFYAGESAFGFQYQDFALEKYQADNGWLQANKGFTIDQASHAVDAILELQRVQIERLLKTMRDNESGDWSLLPALVVERAEIETQSWLPAEIVGAVLEALSIPLGGNAGFERLADFNQAAALPLIALGGERYAALQYYGLVEALYDAPFYWMWLDEAYRDEAAEHRGDFTEAFSFRRLEQVFGETNVHRGLTLWNGKDLLGEIDILVEFGGRLIVAEAKSKRLTLGARHGNDAMLQSDFKEAIQKAHDQALRNAKALLDPNVRIKTADGKPFALTNPPTKIYPICLVADHYPGLVAQVDRFLVKQQVERIASPMVTDIFALDALCEMLDRPLRFLGYFELRDRFGKRFLYSHELVLLALHVKQNLWVENQYDLALLDDSITAEIEIALHARRRGIEGATTPEGPMTVFAGTTFDATLSRIESKPFPAMVDFALFMLEASGGSIKAFNELTAAITNQTRSDLGRHDFSLAIGQAGLSVHCNYDRPREAMERLELHVEGRKYACKADCWYGLLLNPDDGLPIAGLKREFPWQPDEDREAVAAVMTGSGKGMSLRAALKTAKSANRR